MKYLIIPVTEEQYEKDERMLAQSELFRDMAESDGEPRVQELFQWTLDLYSRLEDAHTKLEEVTSQKELLEEELNELHQIGFG